MNKYAFLLLVAITINANAFKIDTHIWVGQQVINDLEDDGNLTFDLEGREVEVPVEPDLVSAILSNRAAFLMGNIGPDASPDVIVGQTVVHPGVENAEYESIGWRTNRWLEYMWRESQGNPVGTAYAYGYLGHAAADVFAHTYVNQYAGDVFRLFDNETLVEQRHFVLENFIGNLTPAITNRQGQEIGKPWEVVTVNDDLANFIRDKLIYSEEIQEEYRKVETTAHITAYYQYRKAISDLAESNVWDELDILITQILVYYFTGETIDDDQAESIAGWLRSAAEATDDGVDAVQEYTAQVYEFLAEYDDRAFEELLRFRDRMRSAEEDWVAKHREWRERLLDVESLPDCPRVYYWSGFPPRLRSREEPACKATKDAIRAANEQVLADAARLEDEALDLRNEFEQSMVDLRTEVNATRDAIFVIEQAAIDTIQYLAKPIRDILLGWRDDVDVALSEYVKATAQSMINTMDAIDSNELDPVVEWFNCYHYSIIGIPSTISNCEVQDAVTQVTESLNNIFAILDAAATLGIDIPNLTELRNLRDQYIQAIQDDLQDQIAEEIIDLLPQPVQDFLAVLDLKVDDAILNDYFTRPEISSDPKGLIMIPDMAQRVRAEMRVQPNGKFDPENYAPAYNAVVMAKLALLSNYDFEFLAEQAGAINFAPYLEIDNIVAQAFANIDGNHQWMPIPPPLPKSRPLTNEEYNINYTYSTDRSQLTGQAHSHGGLGFIPWQGAMRDLLFRKLFRGPLSPGIDSPALINATEVADNSYRYNPCSFNPFPDDINDQRCTIIPLIPVFTLLLN